MTRRKYDLGETELEVLNHVLELGEASVHDVLARINRYRPLAYTTVMTIMRKLERKGYLRHRKDGKAFIYSAAESRSSLRQGLLSKFLKSVFGGSALGLVQTLVTSEELSDEEVEELDRLVRVLKSDRASDD